MPVTLTVESPTAIAVDTLGARRSISAGTVAMLLLGLVVAAGLVLRHRRNRLTPPRLCNVPRGVCSRALPARNNKAPHPLSACCWSFSNRTHQGCRHGGSYSLDRATSGAPLGALLPPPGSPIAAEGKANGSLPCSGGDKRCPAGWRPRRCRESEATKGHGVGVREATHICEDKIASQRQGRLQPGACQDGHQEITARLIVLRERPSK